MIPKAFFSLSSNKRFPFSFSVAYFRSPKVLGQNHKQFALMKSNSAEMLKTGQERRHPDLKDAGCSEDATQNRDESYKATSITWCNQHNTGNN
jgi:hypothetical protein